MSRIARIGGALLSILVRYPSSELKNGADNCLLAAHARWIIKDSCSGIFHGDSRDRAEIFERPNQKSEKNRRDRRTGGEARKTVWKVASRQLPSVFQKPENGMHERVLKEMAETALKKK